MAAVWFQVRADARRRWRAWLLLAVLASLAGAAVMASLAGARRTDSAFDRFLEWSNASDATVFTGAAPLDVDAVRALPEVASAVEARFVWMVGANGVSDLDPVYSDEEAVSLVDRPKVLEGRRPDPDRADEAAISPAGARLTGLGVGDTVTLTALAPEQLEEAFSGGNPEPSGPTVRFTIVGVEASQGGFIQDASLHLTPAFGRRYGEEVATIPFGVVDLERGQADVASFSAGVQRVSRGEQVQVDATADTTREVNRSIDIQATALRLFAALAAVTGLVTLAQALGRQASFQAPDQGVLRALGTTGPQLLAVAALRSLAIGLTAAGLAVAGALAASPHVLFGLAREVEPSPGTSFDGAVLGAGALALVLLTVVSGVLPAWRATRREPGVEQSAAGVAMGPSRAVAALSRGGLPPSAVVGVRMALEPGRGRGAISTRTALAGTTLSLAALVTALTFAASLHHLFDTPRLYGWNWDAVVGSPFDEDTTERIVPRLTDNEAVAEFSLVSYAEVQVAGVRVRAFGFDTVQGSVLPPVVDGREPRGADEIVAGTKTLRQVERSVGDQLELRAGDEVRTMRVVGRGVLPSLGEGDEGGLGEGVFVTAEGLRQLVSEVPTNLYAVRWEPGARPAVRELREFGLQTASPPKGVADFNRVDDLPVVLSALLVVVAAGTLAHTLVTGVRRRRRDLAILKTLGFMRRQVWATVGWQSTTVVGVALVCGVPLGVAGGRWLWRYFADELGTVPQPVTPALALLLLVAATLVAANLLAALPGRSAARTQPALALRSE